MSNIPPGPWGKKTVREPFTVGYGTEWERKTKEILADSDGNEVYGFHSIACRDALTAAESRIRELEAQAETLREMTVRLGEDVMAFGDDDAPPTRAEFLRVVREVNELRGVVSALMTGDGGSGL